MVGFVRVSQKAYSMGPGGLRDLVELSPVAADVTGANLTAICVAFVEVQLISSPAFMIVV